MEFMTWGFGPRSFKLVYERVTHPLSIDSINSAVVGRVITTVCSDELLIGIQDLGFRVLK